MTDPRTGWRHWAPSVSPFESVARLFAPPADEISTTFVDAGPRWRLDEIPGDPAGPIVWGGLFATGGGGPAFLARSFLARQRALRTLRRRWGDAIDGVHLLRSNSERPPIPPSVMRWVRGALLVELRRRSHGRVIDRVATEIGADPERLPGRLNVSGDGSAVARVPQPDGATAGLRLAAEGGRKDPNRNAEALLALERAGVPMTPRLLARGSTSGIDWTVETWLPGQRPTRLSDALVEQIVDLVVQLPRTDAVTTIHDRMQALADRYPRWAVLAAQLAGTEVAVPGVMQHGDLWRGNVLTVEGGMTGVIDWDTWQPGGMPGADLLQLVAVEHRARTGEDIGAQWHRRIWDSDDFRAIVHPYWSRLGIEPSARLREIVGLEWWIGQVFRRQRLAVRPGWIEANVDAVLEAIGGRV